MKTIAVINQKGGACKTTSAVNLAALLGELGERVLLIDLDEQTKATIWLGVGNREDRGLLSVFTEGRPLRELVHETSWPGVDFVPGSRWLMRLSKEIDDEPAREFILRDALRALPRDRWSVVLIDCPPSVGIATVSALAASDEYLVTLETGYLQLDGVGDLMKTVTKVQKRLNPSLGLAGVLVCRATRAGGTDTLVTRDTLGSVRKHFGDKVFSTPVYESTRMKECAGHHVPINQYDPQGVAADNYRTVANELRDRWGASSRGAA